MHFIQIILKNSLSSSVQQGRGDTNCQPHIPCLKVRRKTGKQVEIRENNKILAHPNATATRILIH